VTVAILLGDLRQRAVLAEDGAQGLITALQTLSRLAEEVFTQSVIHGWTSGSVTALGQRMPRVGMFSAGTAGKEKNKGLSRNEPVHGPARTDAGPELLPTLGARPCRRCPPTTKGDDSQRTENAEFLRFLDPLPRELSPN
jgi:hypothetical protein